MSDDGQPPLDEPLAAAGDLPTFLGSAGALTLDDRRTLVEQATTLIEWNYVHLPLKRAMHAVDPVQALRLLADRLAHQTDRTMPEESRFHAELLEIFGSLRDLHTNYLLPQPFASRVAVLPFQVEEYFEDGRRRYQVAHLRGGGDDTFVPGVEITSWSGVPIDRAVEVNADRHAGSNEAARHARGVEYLTVRPLLSSLPPDEEWVEVGYVDLSGAERSIRHEWSVLDISSADHGVDPDAVAESAAALGLDRELDVATAAKRLLYAPPVASRATAGPLATSMPDTLRARVVETRHGAVGHLRIFSFNVDDPAAFVEEVIRLVDQLPSDSLIIDVRGNGGGHIHASEGLLQLFSPRRITPEPTQFTVSELNRRICARHRDNPVGIDLGPWLPSIERAVRTGAVYSSGHPITPDAFANRWGQQYRGRVACITDARCYSATDIFAAGFQDHALGPVVGVDANTGAGGANVWTHELFRQLLSLPEPADETSPYRRLPGGAAMRASVRRTLRVHERAGTPLEDLGVEPDHRHFLTRRDLLEGNVDLLDFTAGLLAARPLRVLDGRVGAVSGGWRQIDITTENIDRVDVFVDERPAGSFDVDAPVVAVDVDAAADSVRLDGWSEGALVASFDVDVT